MTELEKLIEQRKELDKKIKALKCPSYIVDGTSSARFFVRTRHGEPLDNWVVTIKTIDYKDGKAQFKEIITANTKEECITGLKILLNTLTELHGKVLQDEMAEKKND